MQPVGECPSPGNAIPDLPEFGMRILLRCVPMVGVYDNEIGVSVLNDMDKVAATLGSTLILLSDPLDRGDSSHLGFSCFRSHI